MLKTKRHLYPIMTGQILLPGSRLWVQGVRVALFCALLLGNLLPATAQQFESSAILKASQILPRELRSGPDYRVEEKVFNDGYMNIYKIDSKFGKFTPVSTARLRKRIGEIRAMAAMEQVTGTKEFIDAFKEGGQKTLGGAKDLITNPVKTTTAAISGVAKVFRMGADNLWGPTRSKAEDSRLKDIIGFSKVKREYAYEFGVDVYSRNEPLQERLNKITWAGYAGGLSMAGAMVPITGGVGIAISVSRLSRTFNEIFRATPPTQLRRENEKKLLAMGVNQDLVELFINNATYTPREQTLLVLALAEMSGVANRAAFVKFALRTENTDVTLFRQHQAEMYAGYHRTVEPIQRFEKFGGFLAARTGGNKLIANIPLDHLVWTEAMAKIINRANDLVDGLGWVTAKQFWVPGTVSPLARKEMAQRGWQVFEQSEAQLLETVKSYPKYEKTTKTPSGLIEFKSTSIAIGIGVKWGGGKLHFKGKQYAFSIEGVSLVDLGYSSVSATGEVYDLKSASDFAGTYAASQAAFALGGGRTEVTMKNRRGVVISLRSDKQGTALSLGPAGVTIKFK